MHFSPEQLVRGIINNRILIIIAVFVSVIFFGYCCTKIYVDNDNMKSVPDDFKEKVEFNKLKETFPTPFYLIFMAEFEKGSLIEKRDSMALWAKRFERITVDSAKGVLGTIHLGKIKIPVKGGFFGLQSEYVIPKKKKISDEKIRNRIQTNSEFTKTLISEDESILGMVIKINPDLNRPLIVKQVIDIVEQIDEDTTVNTYITGATAGSFLISREMNKDFSFLLPLCLIVASILLYFIFKKIYYVVASLIIIAVSLIWTFGIMGISRIPFTVVTSIIPIIMFPIGVANSIHVLKTYARHRRQQGKGFIESLSETYTELLRPILLTSITTFIGFGSFGFSDISWTRYFGIFTGIGVMLALFFTVLLQPIFLHYEHAQKKIKDYSERGLKISGTFMNRYRTVIFESPFIKFLLLAIFIISIIGILHIRYETNYISMFSPKSTIRKSDDLIARHFGGTRFFYILLTHKEKELSEPVLWAEVDSIIHYIIENENIGDVSSLMPLLRKTSMLLNNKPYSKAAVSLLLKSKGLFGKDFKNLIDSWVTPDKRTTKLSIVCKNIPEFKYTNLAAEIGKHIQKKHPEWEVQIAGPALLIDAMIALLIKTQISSITIAFISVFFVLSLLFKSIRIGAFATIPMILSTIFVYALMGVFNVAIDMVTVIIMNTCIGIGIDYSIHFTAGYMFIKKDYENNIDALIQTVKFKGSVIMFNTYVVGAGFFVLIFSSFPPIRNLGLFISISMLISSTFALIFLPVAFKNYR